MARGVGYEITRFSETPTSILASWLIAHGITLVLDVGAHAGLFAKDLRAAGYSKRIVSFEPASELFARLSTAAAHDPQWDVMNKAVGDCDGEVVLNIAGNDGGANSVLPMMDECLLAAPECKYVGRETVSCVRLDSVVPHFSAMTDRLFLKIDVQGYEKAVLKGGMETLKRVMGVHIELSMVELYSGQELMHETVDHLMALGFKPWGFFPGFYNPQTRRMLCIDGVFFREA